MKQFRLFLAIVAATVALFAAAAALLIWMSPYTLRDATLSFSLGSKPRGLLKTIGVPEGAYNLSRFSVVGPDGPMPEIATRSFEIRSNPEALRQFFETKCKEAGLGPADAEHVRMEPDLLCSFHAPGVDDAVLLNSSCTADTCRVTVEASRVTN
jgi:hypothetical protein